MSVPTEKIQAALPDGLAIRRSLPAGGQRQVFEVETSAGVVAIKFMPEGDRNRAEREVAIGSQFEHPNLPRILDEEVSEVTVDGEEFVWFREGFIEGQTLHDIDYPLEVCEALSLATDLVSAVHYVWDRFSVVHRDIKPKNIIRRPDNSYVLIDCGIGRHQTEESLTTPNMLGPGTMGYAAKEQLDLARSRKLDFRTDLFLVGIVVYEAISGVAPFRSNDRDYVDKLNRGDWPRLSSVPPSTGRLLERLLGTNPHERPTISVASQLIEEAREEAQCS